MYDGNWNVIEDLRQEGQISGYEYEVEACVKAVQQGKTECPEMTHEQTIKMMEVMDEIREKMGVKYPFED